jgi:hypothetical protein
MRCLEDQEAGEFINISGDWVAGFPTRELRCSLSSALVEPSTAVSLMRALEAPGREWPYSFPSEDDEDRDLNEPPYRLLGWISRTHVSDELDGKDTYRNGVSAQHEYPGNKVSAALNLRPDPLPAKKWRSREGGVVLVEQIQWADVPESYDSGSWRQRQTKSEGNLLRITRDTLRTALRNIKMDLIVSVHIERRLEQEYGGRYGEETKKKKTFQKFFVFRANGKIESLKGGVGTWTRDRPSVRSK